MHSKTKSKSTPAPEPHTKRSATSDSSIFTHFVGRLEAKPHQQSRMSLGLFSDDNPPKGFCVTLSPDPETADSVTSRISSPLGSSHSYELLLDITNYGKQKVQAEVWQM